MVWLESSFFFRIPLSFLLAWPWSWPGHAGASRLGSGSCTLEIANLGRGVLKIFYIYILIRIKSIKNNIFVVHESDLLGLLAVLVLGPVSSSSSVSLSWLSLSSCCCSSRILTNQR